MSLFGSSPENSTAQEPASRSKTLFDEGAAPGNNDSIFDNNEAQDSSPWAMPTPKKGNRNAAIRTLLPGSDVPESYIDIYDVVLRSGLEGHPGQISLEGAKKVLTGSEIDSGEQAQILKLVSGGVDPKSDFARSEFNVLLALIALAQQGEEVSLDGVDERRRNLPKPSIFVIDEMRSRLEGAESNGVSSSTPQIPNHPGTSTSSPGKSRKLRKDSLENLDADPWASPVMHKGHTHAVQNEATPGPNVITSARPLANGVGATRTTSAFTTYASEGQSGQTEIPNEAASDGRTGGNGATDWGGFGAPAQRDSQGGSGGFGSARRAIGGGKMASRTNDEVITVALLPEKEGMFLFQHRNYEVKSARRGSSVVRRYSDFVWLLDCLHKRYPFRQLPLLPPKTLAVNGRHLSSDATFIEKRRRGLVRFANALVRHPVLCQEQLVVMFLTVPTEIAVWRKQATISVQEEFTGRQLPPELEDSLPTNLSDTFDNVRGGVKQSAEAYIGICALMERLIKRRQGVAADYARFSTALGSLTESTKSTYALDTNDVPVLNEGIQATARHLNQSQSIMDDEGRAWDEGVLEDLKMQRDSLVGIRDMFDRRDRYAKNNIPQLERRIESNENKLAGIMGRPEGTPSKPGEQERLEEAVRNDKQSIVDQHARGVFIKECIRDELLFFQNSQYHISRLHQDWSQERVKYAELQADNWRSLSEEVEHMPTGD